MTTDRELLEWAAKAAGIEWASALPNPASIERFPSGALMSIKPWNPLVDDGDALRLAVKLRISVMFGANTDVVRCDFTIPDRLMTPSYTHGADDDANAATRRAIVRAAASIGQQKVE